MLLSIKYIVSCNGRSDGLPERENMFIFPLCTYRQAYEQKEKREMSDLDLRIARIDPSRQVSMTPICSKYNAFMIKSI